MAGTRRVIVIVEDDSHEGPKLLKRIQDPKAWPRIEYIDGVEQYIELAHELSPEQAAEAEEQLRICEGSDWCWWFGDYNPGAAVRDFDQLYRRHLKKLYQLLGCVTPSSLDEAISQGGGEAEGGGTMRRGGADS